MQTCALVNNKSKGAHNMRNSNYSGLTAHTLAQKERRGVRTSRKTARHVVPKIGEVIKLDLSMVIQDDSKSTPCVKLSCNENNEWVLVGRAVAGMWIFLNQEPAPHHTSIKITRIIPTQTAAYADVQ